MRAGQAGPALGVGRLGRSSNCSSCSFHAQGQVRIKLTDARDHSIRSSSSVDLTPASGLPRIRTPLKKIEAPALRLNFHLAAKSLVDFQRLTICGK